VIVAASAPHRGEAFAGARALIDRVKAEAPIWKVELTAEGSRRVEGTLPAWPT
jgi:molybdopterin synthase catalytic subunit